MFEDTYCRLPLLFAALMFLISCLFSADIFGQHYRPKQITVPPIRSLKYINTYVLPHKLQFRGTTVGGLSGIDYDPVTDKYFMISDDRSTINPARFYTAHITINTNGIRDVELIGVDTLRQRNGLPYPRNNRKATKATDPEAIRFNGRKRNLIWTSEGERIIRSDTSLLIDPTINIVDTNGRYVDTIPLTENLRMKVAEDGPRRNGVLEAVSFAQNYKKAFVCLEEPLYQDGPRPELTRNHPYIRFYEYNMKKKSNVAQYAYELEPIPEATGASNIVGNNGVPDILWLGKQNFLVTERSYTGGNTTHVKLFISSTKGAANVKNVKSLIQTPPKMLMSKKLLLDMDELGIYIDNIEGATFGPRLPNGHRTLIFLSDDNFLEQEQTQFLLFEILD